MHVSCGSGLFAIKFATSRTYSGVVALDFSENMLLQCYESLKRGPTTLLASDIVLVRADVSRLPFTSCSVDAVHAGAALHCWPSPSKGVAEITRILRNGTWHLCWNHFSAVYSLILLPGCSSHSLRGFFPAGTISGRKRSRTCVHHAVSPTTRAKLSNLSSSFLLRNLEEMQGSLPFQTLCLYYVVRIKSLRKFYSNHCIVRINFKNHSTDLIIFET